MATHAAGNDAAVVLLDADRLDVYRVACEFDAFAARLLPRRGHAGLRDQLSRASTSIALNVAEGGGPLRTREKAHFYLSRAAAPWNAPPSWTCPCPEACSRPPPTAMAAALLIRIVQMLTKLALRMQS